MSRESLMRSIEQHDPQSIDEAAQIAVDVTLDYLLVFIQEFSAELTVAHMYSEALVSGLIHQKVRQLRNGK